MFKKRWLPLPLLLLFLSCAGLYQTGSNTASAVLTDPNRYSPLLVNNQLPAPQSIKSIELYMKDNRGAPPVLTLNSENRLILEFDELSSLGGQYTIRFTHHNPDWSPSNIPEVWFLDGINDLVVQNGTMNSLSRPNYFHYKTEFPNNQLRFTTSGNYLLHVYDFASNTELFSLPFFVSEETGKTTVSTETLHNTGNRGFGTDQLFLEYEYPKEVMFPQFDLTVLFAQNKFWGNTLEAPEKDAADAGKIRFRTSRNHSFPADFDFIPLDLSDLNIDNRRIIDWQPEFTPPRIILREDVLNFSAVPGQQPASGYGYPMRESSARYATVRFSFDSGSIPDRETEIFVSGDFNQWRTDRPNRMALNTETGLWETSLIIKQGRYRYKYFIKNEYAGSEFTPLNDAISAVHQEYTGFVYYKDPDYNYHRLLITITFPSGN